MARFTRKRRFSRIRRRGTRGAWFPTLGTEWDNEAASWWDAGWSDSSGVVPDHRASGPILNCFALTKDLTQFSNTSTTLDGPSLRDIVQGNTWRLNRIVGQLHLQANESNNVIQTFTWPKVQIAAGIFVARTGDLDQSLPDLTQDEIDPFNVKNIQNSWIWRRTWVLSRPLASNVGFSATPCSNNNMAAPSGPYIDTKVKRRILREHRLWFVLGAIGFDGSTQETSTNGGMYIQPFVDYHLDVRIHGQMITAARNATF